MALGRFEKFVVTVILFVLAAIVLYVPYALVKGIALPNAMWAAWGMAVSVFVVILKSVMTEGTEEVRFRQPAHWKLKKLEIKTGEE